jgi:hypothetical protein
MYAKRVVKTNERLHMSENEYFIILRVFSTFL